ncbi:hypothetical protein Cni_G20126 [Canna indica]|uniref:Uncharacterized protein n=1 Tax=Canna indica TaxID=4628 RepID=A0AAQ3KML2_9LILI|nr:hypothetical protein Cni_G20126 [Canna indica]
MVGGRERRRKLVELIRIGVHASEQGMDLVARGLKAQWLEEHDQLQATMNREGSSRKHSLTTDQTQTNPAAGFVYSRCCVSSPPSVSALILAYLISLFACSTRSQLHSAASVPCSRFPAGAVPCPPSSSLFRSPESPSPFPSPGPRRSQLPPAPSPSTSSRLLLWQSGKLIVRDNIDTIRWEAILSYSEDNEGVLCVRKTMWQPEESEASMSSLS